MNDATYDGPNYRCGACSSGNCNLCRDPGCACRETLIALLSDELGWDWNPAPGVPSSRKVLCDIADRILADFLLGYTERVKAEAWDEALRARAAWEQDQRYYVEDEVSNPYRRES